MPQPLHPRCATWGTGSTGGGVCAIDTTAPGYAYRVDGHRPDLSAAPTTEAHAAARLLLQGTFGPTAAAIGEAVGGSAAPFGAAAALAWVEAQMAKPATLHRAHVRARLNPRVADTGAFAPGPCAPGSRWNRAALDQLDVGQVSEHTICM